MFEKIKSLFFTKQFLTFLIIGCINTLNGIIFPYLFSLFLHPNIAYIVSYVPSLTISYFLNAHFTFKEAPTFIKYWKFIVSYIPNFILQNICFLIFFNLLHCPKILAIIVASILGVPLTFLILKFYAFRKKKTDAETGKETA